MSTRIKRSTFLKGFALAGAAALSGKVAYDWLWQKGRIPCRTLGPSKTFGHMLRDKTLAQSSSGELSADVKVIIVGGGMAGLSAAWWLLKKGFTNFKLLELESEVGGNSRSGKNGISAYPWGAHYVPIANDESEYVRMLFDELGIIESYSSTGVPVYNELFLCHDPQERLYKDGTFQEGLVPKRGLQQSDNKEIARFFEMVHEFRANRGVDGKPAFAIPLDLSSQDPQLLALDKISMSDWLAKNGFKSRPLLWYVNYCCKDDYGSHVDKVSAWAGLHYFAGRTGRAVNAETNSVLTWPEGNGYLVNRLKEKLVNHIISNAMVSKVKCDGGRIEIAYMDTSSQKLLTAKSDLLVFAVPRFLSKYLIDDFTEHDHADHAQLVYAPWIVANISLKSMPSSKGE
ncbi:MAG: FAD-dependent oxidoreductase, partial [Candidatus Obscuribacterales bacterium]|nr:FAD-dependent oxidoreductase [Candidatus Obscuribacterales bacterium]